MARKIVRVLSWASGRIPTLLVWAALAGLFVYGARNGWKFGEPAQKGEPKREAGRLDQGDPGSFTPYYIERPFDVPILVTHDPCQCSTFPSRFRSAACGAAAIGATAWLDESPRAIRFKSPESE